MNNTQKPSVTVSEMFENGAHLGFSRRKRHPSVLPFLFGTRGRKDIIDLDHTESQLATAMDMMREAGATGKKVLLVGSKAEAKNSIEKLARATSLPYITERWIGGTITNNKEIMKRVKRLVDLKNQEEKGELIYQTKKELLLLKREIEKLEKNFGGLVELDRIPDLIVIIDTEHEKNALSEANNLDIPVIGICSTDCDITNVAYPIIANDSSVSSISYFTEKLKNAFLDGQNR